MRLPRNKISFFTVVTLLMRLTVGGVFMFSGFVKAVDPWGTYYKFNEYLLTMGLDNLVSLSLIAAVTLAAAEFMLGLLLAVGAYRRVTPWLMLLFLLVMTPITLWLAITDAVPDCGCFGDALHLSNWSTFGKNLLLTAGVVYLIIYNRRLPSIYGPAVQWAAAFFAFVFVVSVASEGYFIQPLIDYRPYEVGTRLTSAARSSQSVDEKNYVFIYERDGVQQQFSIDSVPDEEDGWVYVDRRHIKPAEPAVADSVPSHSIAVRDNGLDVSDMILDPEGRQLLLLFPDLPDVSIAYTFVLNQLNDFASARGVGVYGITSANEEEMSQWNDISMASYPLYSADDSEIKMLARGNPAVVYVDQGIIRWKRTLSSVSRSALNDSSMTVESLSDDFDPDADMMSIFFTFVSFLALLLVINRIPPLVLRLFHRKPKNKES
ncbi:MAG: DoxX family protein [Muribaculaceae bacterium]|nr:DoxX family protein [Muribaculaceae bacterium]MBR3100910.1 DoxX family protein [Muribaculaceae bacterium]